MKIDLAFCERVTATPTSPMHIRRVGPEGRKYGGGAPDTTLCWRALNNGWDLEQPVSDVAVRRLQDRQHDTGSHLLCRECTVAYWELPR